LSKGGDVTTSTTTGELPDWSEPYVTDLLSRAKSVSNLPYATYGNQRLAEFSGDTNASFDMIRDQAAGGTPEVDQAIGATGGIANYAAKGIPQADLSAYMNPYTTNVLDVQKQRATQAFQEQQAGRDASAVAAGAFGGDRRFVQDSLAQRDLNMQMQGIDAEGLQSAYDRATGLFQNDETNRRLGSQLGLDAAGQLGALGQTKSDMGFKNAEALSSVGAKTQQRQQAGLDLAYQDFAAQRDYPAKQLQLYSQLLSGTPITPNTTTSVTEPAPDFLSQLIGLGTGAAGIWDLFN